MAVFIPSDFDTILGEIGILLDAHPGMSHTQGVKDTLMSFYSLVPGDGIYGGSDAADDLGYPDRGENEDLWDEIVTDLIDATDRRRLGKSGGDVRTAASSAPKGRRNPAIERWL